MSGRTEEALRAAETNITLGWLCGSHMRDSTPSFAAHEPFAPPVWASASRRASRGLAEETLQMCGTARRYVRSGAACSCCSSTTCLE